MVLVVVEHEETSVRSGGPARQNLHWAWDIGLLQHISRNPEALAAELETRNTAEDQAEWVKGSIEDWVLEVQVRTGKQHLMKNAIGLRDYQPVGSKVDNSAPRFEMADLRGIAVTSLVAR